MTTATRSITVNVIRYCVSVTLKVNRGGTKKKSNATTPRKEARMAGPRPKATAAHDHAQQVDHREVREVEVPVHQHADRGADGDDQQGAR